MEQRRRRDQGPGGEVLHSHRVILESGEAVGHRRMPGVAGLGEQCEIGQLQLADQLLRALKLCPCTPLDQGSVPQACSQQERSA